MNLFRSNKTAFLKAEVNKDGTIKTTQVVRNSDGSIPDIKMNDNSKVVKKDILFRSYKGLVYSLPLSSDAVLTVSLPSMASKNYVVERKEVVSIN